MTTPSPLQSPAAPGFMAVARTLMLRNLIKAHRAPIGMTFSLLQPIVWLVLFSQTRPARRHRAVPDAGIHLVSRLLHRVDGRVHHVVLGTLVGLSMIADLDTGMLSTSS